MQNLTHYPAFVFALSVVVLWLSAWCGKVFVAKLRPLDPELREDFGVIRGAALTLLALIIGFGFSMALSRYDMRKRYEEAEANAIGTEYVRAELLPAADAAGLRAALRSYLDQRIAFYLSRDEQELQQINVRTAQLQAGLWAAVLPPAAAQPTPVTALAVSGLNDVLNSEGYTQFGYWNRIPTAAWALMTTMAIGCNLLVGYGARTATTNFHLLPLLPLIVSIAFMLIAEIDAPRHGIIRVKPQNLLRVADSLQAHSAAYFPTRTGFAGYLSRRPAT